MGKPGWEETDPKNLMCNTETGQCKCKTGFMDADDDTANGCELSIAEGQCSYGSCENHGVEEGEQCGAWSFLHCAADGCCECDQGSLLEDSRCPGEDVFDVAEDAACDEVCEAKCNAMTTNTAACMDKCNVACENMDKDEADEDKDDYEDEDKEDGEDEDKEDYEDEDKEDYEDEDKEDYEDEEKCDPETEECEKPMYSAL